MVTGGAGFIGSNLVHGLNSAGMKDIVIVDSLVDARKHLNLSKAHITDYFDKDDFPDALAGLSNIDAVFHLGACAVTTEQDGRFMMKNNYTYSKTLLHACLKRKIPFIYASSAAVYGAGEHAFVENDNQEKPLNVYGFSKWAFDQHVMKFLPEAQSHFQNGCQAPGRQTIATVPRQRHLFARLYRCARCCGRQSALSAIGKIRHLQLRNRNATVLSGSG